MQEKQQQRLIPKFDDKENKKLNKSIKELSSEMTLELKDCQKILKEIINDKTDEDDININNINNKQIKQNMKQNIITKINDFTKKFKLNQELYNNKFNHFVIDEEITNKSFSTKKNEENNSNDFLSTQENNSQLRRRDQDLTNLLNSVNELAQIFKDMQTLVMEQGTILDRIDYNIDIASTNVSKGKKNITKADKYSVELVQERYSQIFGTDQVAPKEDVDVYCYHVDYDTQDGCYYGHYFAGGGGMPWIADRRIESASRSDDGTEIYLYEYYIRAGIMEDKSIYTYGKDVGSPLGEEAAATYYENIKNTNINNWHVKDEIFEKYKDQLVKFKSTFKLDTNGNYYWVSTEPVK